jgi:hypothetical protein
MVGSGMRHFSVSFGEKTPRLLGEDFSTIGMCRTTGQHPTPCKVLSPKTTSIFLYRCLPIFLSPSSCNRSKEKLPTSFSPNTKTSQSTSGVATYGGGDTSQLPPATLPMKSLWSIVPHRKFKRTMVTSILPHKEEAASADSNLPPVGSFKPTSFSWWWFSYWRNHTCSPEIINRRR